MYAEIQKHTEDIEERGAQNGADSIGCHIGKRLSLRTKKAAERQRTAERRRAQADIARVDCAGRAAGGCAEQRKRGRGKEQPDDRKTQEIASAEKKPTDAERRARPLLPQPRQRLTELPAPMPSVKPTVCSRAVSAKHAPMAAESCASLLPRISVSSRLQKAEATMAATLGAAIFSVRRRTSPASHVSFRRIKAAWLSCLS